MPSKKKSYGVKSGELGANRTKQGYPHQHAQSSHAEVRRTGTNELECSPLDKWVPRPMVRQNTWNQQLVVKATTTA